MVVRISTWFKDERFEIDVMIDDNVSNEALTAIAFDYAMDELFAHGAGWDYNIIEEGKTNAE
jgi:hypothetical protein